MDVASGKSFRFSPYPRTSGRASAGLMGFGFAGPDKLVTITDLSGFDVWQLPGMQRVGGQPSRPGGSIPFVGTAGVAWLPSNYGLSADGKTLAVFDGTGFSFFDAATAAPRAKSEPVIQPNGQMNFWGAAFSADGTKFPCLCSVYQPKEATALLVWNPVTGQRLSTAPVGEKSGLGLAWGGPDHVVLFRGGQAEAEVLAVRTGQVVAQIETELTGGRLIAPVTAGDKLWYVFNSGGIGLDGAAAPRLVSVAAPPRLPGRMLNLTTEGPRWR